jgi:glycosyltransferase involved in cell wall biosynthesis
VHFPHFFGEFTQSFRDIYRLAMAQPGVSFNNNSRAGAESYAKWLGVPSRRIPVVPNCVTQEFTSAIGVKPVAAWRKRLGLKKEQPLILGVFRLSAEKLPLDFVRTIAALHHRMPELRAVICGQAGNQEKETRALIRKLKLDSVITLAGVTDEIPAAMKAATLLLHVSKAEGAANVILEAQAVGLPVVCTKFEGNLEVLHRGWLPYARKPGDIRGLSAACAKLIGEPKLRRKIAGKARAVVRKNHSLSRLTRETLRAKK